MISFIIDFDKPFDALRFLHSVMEVEKVTEYSVKSERVLSFTLACKDFSSALLIVQTVQTILVNSKLDVRPFCFSFSELLD